MNIASLLISQTQRFLPEEATWLLTGLGAIGVLAWIYRNVVGGIATTKQLKGGTVTPLPLPVIIEKSLAEKFVGMPHFEKFEAYVHKAHHEIKNEVQASRSLTEDRYESNRELIMTNRSEMEELARELNRENERRTEGIHRRINTVAEEMPNKVIALLRDTGHLRLPGKNL